MGLVESLWELSTSPFFLQSCCKHKHDLSVLFTAVNKTDKSLGDIFRTCTLAERLLQGNVKIIFRRFKQRDLFGLHITKLRGHKQCL